MIYIDEGALETSLGHFSDGLRRLADASGKEMGVVVKATGRLLACDLVLMTQPFSGKDGNINEAGVYRGGYDRELGERAVMRDVGRVYSSIGSVYAQVAEQKEDAAKGFWRAIKQRKIGRAVKILESFGIELGAPIGEFDQGLAHLSSRNRRGRVSRGQTALLIVTNPAKLRAYVKELKRRVGEAKGGWADGAKVLGGTRGIPQWVTRNAVGRGGATDNSESFNHPHVILHNGVKYITDVCDDDAQNEAVYYRAAKMETQIEKIILGNARREGFATHS